MLKTPLFTLLMQKISLRLIFLLHTLNPLKTSSIITDERLVPLSEGVLFVHLIIGNE